MAGSQIENIGRRPHIRRTAHLRLPLDTPSHRAERALAIVREILSDHEGLDPKFPPRVSLSDIEDDALIIKMIYWYHPPNYWDFLAACERVNLAIKTRFEKEGLKFALPTTSTHLSSGNAELVSPHDEGRNPGQDESRA